MVKRIRRRPPGIFERVRAAKTQREEVGLGKNLTPAVQRALDDPGKVVAILGYAAMDPQIEAQLLDTDFAITDSLSEESKRPRIESVRNLAVTITRLESRLEYVAAHPDTNVKAAAVAGIALTMATLDTSSDLIQTARTQPNAFSDEEQMFVAVVGRYPEMIAHQIMRLLTSLPVLDPMTAGRFMEISKGYLDKLVEESERRSPTIRTAEEFGAFIQYIGLEVMGLRYYEQYDIPLADIDRASYNYQTDALATDRTAGVSQRFAILNLYGSMNELLKQYPYLFKSINNVVDTELLKLIKRKPSTVTPAV